MTEEDEFDYANILHGEWQWPLGNGPVRKESFFELFDQAEKQSLSLIQAYEAGPVSYTHLDVYKRQDIPSAASPALH